MFVVSNFFLSTPKATPKQTSEELLGVFRGIESDSHSFRGQGRDI